MGVERIVILNRVVMSEKVTLQRRPRGEVRGHVGTWRKSRPGFLNMGNIDSLGEIILHCREGCHVHRRMFSGIP